MQMDSVFGSCAGTCHAAQYGRCSTGVGIYEASWFVHPTKPVSLYLISCSKVFQELGMHSRVGTNLHFRVRQLISCPNKHSAIPTSLWQLCFSIMALWMQFSFIRSRGFYRKLTLLRGSYIALVLVQDLCHLTSPSQWHQQCQQRSCISTTLMFGHDIFIIEESHHHATFIWLWSMQQRGFHHAGCLYHIDWLLLCKLLPPFVIAAWYPPSTAAISPLLSNPRVPYPSEVLQT